MKKIFEARFVRMGLDQTTTVFEMLSPKVPGRIYPFEELDNVSFVEDATFEDCRKAVATWIESLNSGDAPEFYIEKLTEPEYALRFHKGGTFETTGSIVKAVLENVLPSIPIYTPKKYEAKWERLYPREFARSEVLDATMIDEQLTKRAWDAIDKINQLQQTEASGLEVWELTVTEESE